MNPRYAIRADAWRPYRIQNLAEVGELTTALPLQFSSEIEASKTFDKLHLSEQTTVHLLQCILSRPLEEILDKIPWPHFPQVNLEGLVRIFVLNPVSQSTAPNDCKSRKTRRTKQWASAIISKRFPVPVENLSVPYLPPLRLPLLDKLR